MAALGLDPDDFGSPDAPDVAGEDVEATPPAPVLAVVGRPNVGKSTLVNRMLGRREAVVQDIPGVTRDRVAYDAMRTADAVLLVVDASVGATATDEAVARVLRRSNRPVLLAATKVDDDRLTADTASLWRLGLGEPHPVSGLHGRGAGDLLDAVLDALPESPRDVDTGTGGPPRGAPLGPRARGEDSP